MEHATSDTPLLKITSQPKTLYPLTTDHRALMCDIRNMRVLSDSNRRALHYCDRAQLLEIIEIYNLIMQNIEYMFG